MSKTIRRFVASAMLVLPLLIAGAFVSVPKAGASTTVCKAAATDIDGVCMTVGGKDGNVVNVDITGFRADKWAPSICDYSTVVRVSFPANISGPGPVYTRSSGGPLGCSRMWADFNIPVQRTFPIGSYVCAKFFVGGRQVAAEQCVKLTKAWR